MSSPGGMPGVGLMEIYRILEVHARRDSKRARGRGRELLTVGDGLCAEGVVLGAGQVGAPKPEMISAARVGPFNRCVEQLDDRLPHALIREPVERVRIRHI